MWFVEIHVRKVKSLIWNVFRLFCFFVLLLMKVLRSDIDLYKMRNKTGSSSKITTTNNSDDSDLLISWSVQYRQTELNWKCAYFFIHLHFLKAKPNIYNKNKSSLSAQEAERCKQQVFSPCHREITLCDLHKDVHIIIPSITSIQKKNAIN